MTMLDLNATDVRTIMCIMREHTGSINFPYLKDMDFTPQTDIADAIPQKLLVGQFEGDPVYCYIENTASRGAPLGPVVRTYCKRQAPTAFQSDLDTPHLREIVYREPFSTLAEAKSHIADVNFSQHLGHLVKASFIMMGLTKSTPLQLGSTFNKILKAVLKTFDGTTRRSTRRKSTKFLKRSYREHSKREDTESENVNEQADHENHVPFWQPRPGLSATSRRKNSNVRSKLISAYLREEFNQQRQQHELNVEESDLDALSEHTKAPVEQIKCLRKQLENASTEGNNRKRKIHEMTDTIEARDEKMKRIRGRMTGEEGYELAMRLMHGALEEGEENVGGEHTDIESGVNEETIDKETVDNMAMGEVAVEEASSRAAALREGDVKRDERLGSEQPEDEWMSKVWGIPPIATLDGIISN
jgi:hypothetical protein